MVKCKQEMIESPYRHDQYFPGYVYCPDWSDKHELRASYRHNLKSWVRLAVHKCDNETRALEGKVCKSDEEINQWLYSNIYLA